VIKSVSSCYLFLPRKPMHMQPIYRMNGFVTKNGNGRGTTNAYIANDKNDKDSNLLDIGMNIFERGLCLPSDNKMTEEEQDRIIAVIRACFE
jgi:dTDP-4-amino-4,6-dideoxygalactose transaminase